RGTPRPRATPRRTGSRRTSASYHQESRRSRARTDRGRQRRLWRTRPGEGREGDGPGTPWLLRRSSANSVSTSSCSPGLRFAGICTTSSGTAFVRFSPRIGPACSPPPGPARSARGQTDPSVRAGSPGASLGAALRHRSEQTLRDLVALEPLHDHERLHQRVDEAVAILPRGAGALEDGAALRVTEVVEVLCEARDRIGLAGDLAHRPTHV